LKQLHLIVLYSLVGLLLALTIWRELKTNPEANQEEILIQTEEGESLRIMMPDSKARIFDIPTRLSFAGEEVPMKLMDVRERFERELYVNVYWQSNMILLMKRSGKYLPTIEKILAEQGIPDDFKYLAMAESGLMNVVSPADARGFWQILKGTAKDYGLEVSDEVDERYHLEKSTKAACHYLKSAYAKFGNWTSVAASYNAGIAGIRKRKEEQHKDNYFDLHLVEETSRYLFRILAFKEIFDNPERYGFELGEKDRYHMPVFRELAVDQDIPDLAAWAIRHGSNYKELKLYNPWLRDRKLPVKRGKRYLIKLPLEN
jgi:membrane-bound lytic murein transglycosylase D